jgi:CubicO group peptidase (beta-lactamase class C family)
MKTYIRIGAAVLMLALPRAAPVAGAKAPSNVQEVDRQLAELLREGKIPGASVAIIENGQITLAKGYGFADVARKIPATADTPFRAGSISKSITSIAVMTLVDQGKLSLDARLADFAPAVRFVNPWEKTNPVRLANLLEHTTGWPDVSTRVLAKSEKDWSTLRGVEFASPEFVSRWRPGTLMVYCNAGPAVAAVAVEKATGKTFEAYVRDAVLRPMGMATADFDLTPDLARRISRSYAPDGSETPYQHIVLRPAGSLNVSARELVELARFYLADGAVNGRRLLSAASVARIERSETNLASRDGFVYGYGLGNAIFPDSGLSFRGHNGSIDSFTSVLGYSRRANSGYVLMANGGQGVDFATPAARLVQSYLTRGTRMVTASSVRMSGADLKRYAGFYRVVSPPGDLLRPYVDILGIARVRAGDGKLIVSGHDFFPVSAHLFRRFDREEPSLAFVEDGGRVYKIGAFNGAVKESFWLIAAIFLVGGLLALGALVALVMLIPWIISAARGRLADRGGLWMRLAPPAAIAALGVTMVLPIRAFMSSGVTAVPRLAEIGPYSLTVMACSVLVPVLALAGLVLAIRNADARLFVRGYAALTSLALLAVSGYLASIGWLAVQTWKM